MGLAQSATRVDTTVSARRHTPPALSPDEVAALRAAAPSGTVLLPGDAGYDRARRAWNAAACGFPSAVVAPGDAADVQGTVRAAADVHRARGGGGSGGLLAVAGKGRRSGNPSPDGSVLLDFSSWDAVRVDVAARTACAQAGCVVADVDAAAAAHGLAAPTGANPRCGLAGLVGGGGYGFLSGAWGLTSESVVAAEVVLPASGEVVAARDGGTAEEAAALQALRAGGDAVFVVLSLTLRLRELPEDASLYCARRQYAPVPLWYEHPLAALARARDCLEAADCPAELGAAFVLPTGVAAPAVVQLVYCGGADEGRRLLSSAALDHGRPFRSREGPLPFVEAQALAHGEDGLALQAGRYAVATLFLPTLCDEALHRLWGLAKGREGSVRAEAAPAHGSCVVVQRLPARPAGGYGAAAEARGG
eukprot:Rhum_TRINITY_DN14846_c7_g1::Rhum_TRINITY_DN14846_c7_g1_i1::g.122899::m.122899